MIGFRPFESRLVKQVEDCVHIEASFAEHSFSRHLRYEEKAMSQLKTRILTNLTWWIYVMVKILFDLEKN